MERRVLLAAAAAALLAAALAAGVYSLHSGGGGAEGGGGLLVVASMPSLAGDARLLACSGDRVVSLLPEGADPHVYQLGQRQLELLREASLVVVVGKAPFEVKVLQLLPGDKVLAVLRLEGLRLLENPVTGKPVYHMPIYEPGNYRVFMEALASRLEALRPGCAGVYREKLEAVMERLEGLEEARGLLGGRAAVGSTPVVVYPASWLGLRVEWLLVPEAGVAASQESLERARQLLGEGAVAVVLVDSRGEPLTQADRRLAAMAAEAGAPLLRVPAPWLPGSTLEKLERLAAEARTLAGGG